MCLYKVTVDWDKFRERPELLAEGLEALAETLPADGGSSILRCILWMFTAVVPAGGVEECGDSCFLEGFCSIFVRFGLSLKRTFSSVFFSDSVSP